MDILTSKKATWLVTGSAGFIGSHLIEALLKNDQQVIGLDNFFTGKKENIANILESLPPEKSKNFTFVEGDIREYKTCSDLTKGVDYVLHQAALGSVSHSLKDPLIIHDINVTGFLNVLQAAQENKVSCFVYASSSAVYGDMAQLPQGEDCLGHLLSPYAASKRMNELYGQVFSRCYGIPTIGLRYFNVFGPRQDPEGPYAAVIPIWIRALMNAQPCFINGDGLVSRDFCYVDDVVQANIRAALCKNIKAYGNVFNIGYGKRTTLLELYSLMRSALNLGNGVSPMHRDARPGDVSHSLADIENARNILGYHPMYSLEKGLKLTIS